MGELGEGEKKGEKVGKKNERGSGEGGKGIGNLILEGNIGSEGSKGEHLDTREKE